MTNFIECQLPPVRYLRLYLNPLGSKQTWVRFLPNVANESSVVHCVQNAGGVQDRKPPIPAVPESRFRSAPKACLRNVKLKCAALDGNRRELHLSRLRSLGIPLL